MSVIASDRFMSWSRVKGVLMQSIYVMKHSPLRIMEMIYWPFIEIILWGFITRYLQDTDAAVPWWRVDPARRGGVLGRVLPHATGAGDDPAHGHVGPQHPEPLRVAAAPA